MQLGAQKGHCEPPFSREKNPEERRLILEKGDKILKTVKMRGEQKVPDVAKVRDRKPGLWIVGARLAGVRDGPSLAAMSPAPFLSPGPIPAPTW